MRTRYLRKHWTACLLAVCLASFLLLLFLPENQPFIVIDMPLVDPDPVYQFDWSPDGNKFVCSTEGGIFVMNIDGSNITEILLNYSTWLTRPRFSPDGKRILLQGVLDGGYISDSNIYVVNLDGTGLRQLTSVNGSRDPDWSPDGGRIVFARHGTRHGAAEIDEGLGGIWVMDADGGNQRRLTEIGFQPAWSPDGKSIAYAIQDVNASLSGELSIHILSLDDGRERQLPWTTELPGGVTGIDWTPDGRWLIAGINEHIYIINVDRGYPQWMIPSLLGRYNMYPRLSPDGTTLAYTQLVTLSHYTATLKIHLARLAIIPQFKLIVTAFPILALLILRRKHRI